MTPSAEQTAYMEAPDRYAPGEALAVRSALFHRRPSTHGSLFLFSARKLKISSNRSNVISLRDTFKLLTAR